MARNISRGCRTKQKGADREKVRGLQERSTSAPGPQEMSWNRSDLGSHHSDVVGAGPWRGH
jgi:hypothetical protein